MFLRCLHHDGLCGKQSAEVQENLLGGEGSGSVSPNVVFKLSAELYDVLCQVVSGEAMTILRTVEDCRGFVAWQKLYQKFNPKTVARAIRLLAEACSPAKVRELVDVDPAICVWEHSVALLSKEFNEQVSNNMKVAIVTSMLPPSIQDNVYTSVDCEVSYEVFISKIWAVVGNKVAMMTKPTPRDIGTQPWTMSEETAAKMTFKQLLPTPDVTIAMVGDIFPASALPSAMGLPRGGARGNAKSKGKGKGGGKAGVKGCCGRGVAFKGSCFACGKTGHRANECTERAANSVEDAGDEDASVSPIGGVWMIAAVESREHHDEGFQMVSKRTVRNKTRKSSFQTMLKDSFEPLSECCPVQAVEAKVQKGAIEFNVADVRKPLASAVKMVRAGNRIIFDDEGSYGESKSTGERMRVDVKDGTFVFNVTFENGEEGTITLDSGAGVNVWPKHIEVPGKNLPKKQGLRMCAANGTEISNLGRRVIAFAGRSVETPLSFSRQA